MKRNGKVKKTSPKGFSASKRDIGNWIFSKLGIFEKLLDFFGLLGGFFWIFLDEFFWRITFGGFFWMNFLGGFFGGDLFWRIFLGGILCLHFKVSYVI